jgi:hypothetical protein
MTDSNLEAFTQSCNLLAPYFGVNAFVLCVSKPITFHCTAHGNHTVFSYNVSGGVNSISPNSAQAKHLHGFALELVSERS